MELRICDDCKQRKASVRCICPRPDGAVYMQLQCWTELCIPCVQPHFKAKHLKELGEREGTAPLPRE